MSESPFGLAAEPLGVTIKFGKGYEDTWITIRGTNEIIRETLIETFDLDREGADGLSTAALVSNATQAAHALNAVASGLGGRAISGGGSRGRGSNPAAWQGAKSGAPAEPSPEEKAKAAREVAVKEINEAGSVDVLKRWWAENQEVFKDPEVEAAWKAKGKALKSGGK